ncbi:MAG: nucleotidyltransferase substrate binding protein [Oligoflexia bacterium]|nr:nucleotidyltransferase substrate binding protein [Oligoflexia bacterium]
MQNIDLRWKQRFSNFKKALLQLNEIVHQEKLNKFEEQGLIQAFGYTYELAWKTLQDYLRYKRYNEIAGPRPVIEQSFQDGIITNGEEWMKMFKDRNLTSHTYDEIFAKEISRKIKDNYFTLLDDLGKKLDSLATTSISL